MEFVCLYIITFSAVIYILKQLYLCMEDEIKIYRFKKSVKKIEGVISQAVEEISKQISDKPIRMKITPIIESVSVKNAHTEKKAKKPTVAKNAQVKKTTKKTIKKGK